MEGMDRTYAELAGVPLCDDDGHITAAGQAVAIREEVDYLIEHQDTMRDAILAAIADPDDRWHDELILRLTA